MSESPSIIASQAEALTTIDAERCPTCNEARFVLVRGDRVACPTCCSTMRLGEVDVSDGTQRRLQMRGPTIFIAVAIAIGMLALWTNGLLALR
jgi:ribosomal protein S27AE